jgi:hypothetical protein
VSRTKVTRDDHMASIVSTAMGLSADLKKPKAENGDPELVLIMEDQLADILTSARHFRNGRRCYSVNRKGDEYTRIFYLLDIFDCRNNKLNTDKIATPRAFCPPCSPVSSPYPCPFVTSVAS